MYISKDDRDSFIGRRVHLISMGDDPNPIPSGSKGTIQYIDDIGTIHVKWDDGRILGLVPNEDIFEVLDKTCQDRSFKDCHLFLHNHCIGCPMFK